ncbi:hypothetical protein [Ruegeria conchae]|uniref:hypothetical protein n=1 Tax=Ruegeria conchae TaxID=981384 RepID=UPI000311C12C|nr:hypothetical protein [Ruegeria conchae]
MGGLHLSWGIPPDFAKGRDRSLGGSQADTNWLIRVWGEPAKNFLIKGTAQCCGVVLPTFWVRAWKV